jgi:hypothetical protein
MAERRPSVKTAIWQHVKAPNDNSGNPRRLYLVYRRVQGYMRVAYVIEEGYSGRPRELRHKNELPSMTVSASEYRDWVRVATQSGIYIGRFSSGRQS